MRVHIARLGDPTVDAPADAFLALARSEGTHPHVLTSDPSSADCILFTQAHMLGRDWELQRIQEHPLARRYRSKVFVYDERDRPYCIFPGVYVSMPRTRWHSALQCAWGYYVTPLYDLGSEPPDLLFSLIASPSAPCRRPLFTLSHPDAVVERVDGFRFFDPTSVRFAERQTRFRSILARSRFVLCPRGHGTSSIRLYETLAAGRVPVIISDDWVAPAGPDWHSFSVRWPEGQTAGLVEMLQDLNRRWAEMSRRASTAFSENFSRSASLRRILDLCESLLPVARHLPPQPLRGRRNEIIESSLDVTRRVQTALERRGVLRPR